MASTRARGGLAVLGTALLLAACGGGGGGGGSAVPSAAVPQAGFTLPAGSDGSTVIAQSGSGGGGTTVRSTGVGSAVISVDGVTRTWQRTPDGVGDVEVTKSADGRAIVVTARNGANAAGPAGMLDHTSYGIWVESSAVSVLAGSSNDVTRVSSFVVGDATPVGDMPTSGSASYRGEAVAIELRGGASPRPLSGPLTATADFGTGRVTATADLTGSADGSSFGRVSMSNLAISGNRFSGAASSSAGHVGVAEGGFAGPAAVELGGTFELNGPSTVHGAFAGTSR